MGGRTSESPTSGPELLALRAGELPWEEGASLERPRYQASGPDPPLGSPGLGHLDGPFGLNFGSGREREVSLDCTSSRVS